jgi:hypothetical protein
MAVEGSHHLSSVGRPRMGFVCVFFFGPYRGPTRRPVVPYVLLLGVVMQLPKYDGAGRAVMVPG